MARPPDFFVYERSLPILGVDGTLAKAVAADSPAKGQVKPNRHAHLDISFSTAPCTSKASPLSDHRQSKRLAFAAFINGVHLKDGIDARPPQSRFREALRNCACRALNFSPLAHLITDETRPASNNPAA